VTGVLDRFRLDGKAAVVTGVSSGLGVQFAQALAQADADLALGARREDRRTSPASRSRLMGVSCSHDRWSPRKPRIAHITQC
jgi:NAD(P)-dependent dehydrogenase (short-subunit alcohol dehydrogenase family)